jgi:translation initiation factor 2B subunit (eIF-2B alpha/beta/delta family)
MNMKTVMEIVQKIKNAKNNSAFDLATKEAAQFLINQTNDEPSKNEIKLALKEMTDKILKESKRLIDETDDIIHQSQAFRLVTVEVGGKKYSSKEWMTYSNYCKNFNLNSTAVVTNWIKRGIVPSENLLFIKEMNLKLIKAVPYMT